MNPVPLIIATTNKNKIKEMEALLADTPLKIMNLDDFGPTPEPVEDADTFEENAYKKAHFYARILGFPAMADDSGLSVEALDGEPGVHSSRWAGENATDEEKCTLVLSRMNGRKNRKASFTCSLVLAVPAGPALTWINSCDGELTTKPRGSNGFGYDPIFYYPPLKKTFAQLTRQEKGQVSHRGRALSEFKSELDKVLIWLQQRLDETRPQH
ncbi:MAG: XTP/dITP diphosphatase [Deltaproteobacteria bacterium]|nr:XTP/dITP diphosphatase [Deltaproteobacteria bacterium]